MDARRLTILLELSRLGSMREVADELGLSTSTVSQQVAALAREAGTALVEPDGRRVALTPAGHRLAGHAVSILAALEAARLDLDPDAEPAGRIRVAGFATAVRRTLLPVVAELATSHPGLEVSISECEPLEAFDLLARDDVDLALTYDYNLAPASLRDDLEATPLWTVPWGLGVPADEPPVSGDATTVVAAFAEHPWVVNSRNTADLDAVHTLASMAGFTPRIAHHIDSLDLVEDLIVAGHGVGLRAYTVVRRGRARWSPLRLLLDRLHGH